MLAKQAAPLERMALSQEARDAVARYEERCQRIAELNADLQGAKPRPSTTARALYGALAFAKP